MWRLPWSQRGSAVAFVWGCWNATSTALPPFQPLHHTIWNLPRFSRVGTRAGARGGGALGIANHCGLTRSGKSQGSPRGRQHPWHCTTGHDGHRPFSVGLRSGPDSLSQCVSNPIGLGPPATVSSYNTFEATPGHHQQTGCLRLTPN